MWLIALALLLAGAQGGFLGAIVVAVPAWLLAIGGTRCARYGKKLSARTAEAVVLRDPRPPVLYLRSFQAEETTSKGLPDTVFSEQIVTEEEQLAKAMNDLGPLIAIGKPGEKLPVLGAARLYADEDEWEQVINDLLARARLVVIRIGVTGGLLWELRQAFEHLEPDRLLLLVPDDRAQYEAFREAAVEILPCSLPNFPEAATSYPKTLRGFLRFDDGWDAEYIDLKPAPFFRASRDSLVPGFRLGLQPVYQQLGIPWSPPGLNWAVIFILGSSVSILFVALIVITFGG